MATIRSVDGVSKMEINLSLLNRCRSRDRGIIPRKVRDFADNVCGGTMGTENTNIAIVLATNYPMILQGDKIRSVTSVADAITRRNLILKLFVEYNITSGRPTR